MSAEYGVRWGIMFDRDSQHLTLAEAAEMLFVSPATLGRWARDGRIPCEMTARGSPTFRRSDLLEMSSLSRAENDDDEKQ